MTAAFAIQPPLFKIRCQPMTDQCTSSPRESRGHYSQHKPYSLWWLLGPLDSERARGSMYSAGKRSSSSAVSFFSLLKHRFHLVHTDNVRLHALLQFSNPQLRVATFGEQPVVYMHGASARRRTSKTPAALVGAAVERTF